MHKTDRLFQARFGVMEHFLIPSADKLHLAAEYDANAVAEQLHRIGAGYLLLTLGQNSGYYCAPNDPYEDMLGYKRGSHCSESDLPARLLEALSKYNIRLMLYATCQTPNTDHHAQQVFGLLQGQGDQLLTLDFAKKWVEILSFWAERYGTAIAGWWLDGGFRNYGATDQIMDLYAQALRRPNPDTVIAFNPGGCRVIRNAIAEDYTAGEMNEPLDTYPQGRFLEGLQWQILTYIGEDWGMRTPRYTPEAWSNWAKQVFAKGGVITVDSGPCYDSGIAPIGTLSPQAEAYLTAIGSAAALYRK